MNQDLPEKLDRESLCQLSKEELVDIIIEQAIVTKQLQATITELKQEIQRLVVSRNLDSKTSSKPPSSDLLKKSENKKAESESQTNDRKRKPGGQLGHTGKTRKGFGRVDRYEVLRPQVCLACGHTEFVASAVKVEKQQVAQLVERPIEIVEYHRHSCQCRHCDAIQTAEWSNEIIPGQDLGVRLQAFLGWIGNYGHLPYEKQSSFVVGVGTN